MELGRFLREFDPGRHLPIRERFFFSIVSSTNRVARALAAKYLDHATAPPFILISALEQLAGRGRLDRVWQSPRGGIYVSLVAPVRDSRQLQALPQQVPIGLCSVLNHEIRGRCQIKWPNDLLVEGRKIGGILIEAVHRLRQSPVAIIGFGINYAESPKGTARVSTCVRSESGRASNLPTLSRSLIGSVLAEIQQPTAQMDVRERYEENSWHRRGDEIVCLTRHGVVEGRFKGFDENGFLRLDSAAGERVVGAGELIEAGRGYRR